MDTLQSVHLLTLSLHVATASMLNIGKTVLGRRLIATITGGTFTGDRLRGSVLPGGADWVLNRPDGALAIDVRLTLKTDDEALIYCSYQGSFRAAPEAMTRFSRGELLAEGDYKLRTHVRFETGTERYAWLNDMPAIGVGRQTAQGPVYSIFEIL